MSKIKAQITNYDLITAYGRGLAPLWEGILSGKSRIDKLERFPTSSCLCHNAATISELSRLKQDSLVMQMLKTILTKIFFTCWSNCRDKGWWGSKSW